MSITLQEKMMKPERELENLRAWIHNMSVSEREMTAKACDYRYHTLVKFGNRQVIDPAYTRVETLKRYKTMMRKK